MTQSDYVIFTDSNSEIPLALQQEYNIPYMRMPYTLDGKEVEYDLGEKTDSIDFFKQLRAGKMPITTQKNPLDFVQLLTPALAEGKDVLFISFSSQMSGNYNSGRLGIEMLKEEYPDRRIEIFDTLTICIGEAILVRKAVMLRADGASMDAVLNFLEKNAQRSNVYLTADDLFHLKRGGRVSGATALIGTMLEIKPILSITAQGKITSCGKAKGRKKALRMLADYVAERAEDAENELIYIVHGDCMDDAEFLKEMILQRIAVGEINIQLMGPVIGTHAGAGTIGVSFFGKVREPAE